MGRKGAVKLRPATICFFLNDQNDVALSRKRRDTYAKQLLRVDTEMQPPVVLGNQRAGSISG